MGQLQVRLDERVGLGREEVQQLGLESVGWGGALENLEGPGKKERG